MHYVLGLVVLAGCRMNFDPIDGDPEDAEDVGASVAQIAEPDSDFFTVCTPGQPCAVDCTAAATCFVACNGASFCDVACSAADCVVEACLAATCDVDCRGMVATFGVTTFCDGG